MTRQSSIELALCCPCEPAPLQRADMVRVGGMLGLAMLAGFGLSALAARALLALGSTLAPAVARGLVRDLQAANDAARTLGRLVGQLAMPAVMPVWTLWLTRIEALAPCAGLALAVAAWIAVCSSDVSRCPSR